MGERELVEVAPAAVAVASPAPASLPAAFGGLGLAGLASAMGNRAFGAFVARRAAGAVAVDAAAVPGCECGDSGGACDCDHEHDGHDHGQERCTCEAGGERCVSCREQAAFAGAESVLARACLPAEKCTPARRRQAGSSASFGRNEEAVEESHRRRRARMTPTRQRVTGHVGPAAQLERFLRAEAPTLLTQLHGIFVDQDLSPGTGALTMPCDEMVPSITGATRECIFIHGRLNQEGLAYNEGAERVGGRSRRAWRDDTVALFTHEVQHVRFDTSRTTDLPGVPCRRSTVVDPASGHTVQFELSELNAILSEFRVYHQSAATGGAAERRRLEGWLRESITNSSESIRGTLSSIRCVCDCADVDAYVRDTVGFATSGWTAAERNALNAELRQPRWNLGWPL